ncbi:MAG TPA: aldo/keto reductase [bacterium]|nr:aldo/keto reductase [bacterium]
MRTRTLGKSDLHVLPLGLGCMSLSGTYGPSEDAEGIRVIHRALDLGINLLDSSDMYGWGHNEELLGKALKGRRAQVVLATKFGQTKGGVRGDPDYVQQACEASLKRLGVDVIDLYYQHRVDPAVPIEDTVGAMSRLVEQGKVRYLGLSEAAPATLRRAQRVVPITAVQTEYSLMYRDVAEATLAVCREFGIGFVAYAALGRGLLTGAVQDLAALHPNDRRLQHPRFQDANFQHNLNLVRRIQSIAREKRVQPSQLVLAWVLAQGEDIVSIPGTKSIPRLEENLGALDVQLTPEDLRSLEQALPPGAAAGARYPEPQLKALQL